jgi:hypothetical protein
MNDIDFQIVDVENELEKRREKENSNIVPAATGASSNVGCASTLLLVMLGIIIFKLFGELLFIFK